MGAEPSICVWHTKYKVLFSLFSLGLLADCTYSALLVIQSYFIHASLFYV